VSYIIYKLLSLHKHNLLLKLAENFTKFLFLKIKYTRIKAFKALKVMAKFSKLSKQLIKKFRILKPPQQPHNLKFLINFTIFEA
jgi:competence protein ComGF